MSDDLRTNSLTQWKCGALTDLPAVWSCPCGAYTTCQRSGCILRVPQEHRDGRCKRPDEETRARRFVGGLMLFTIFAQEEGKQQEAVHRVIPKIDRGDVLFGAFLCFGFIICLMLFLIYLAIRGQKGNSRRRRRDDDEED